MNHKNFKIHSLGTPTVQSPLQLSKTKGDGVFNFISEDDRVLHDISTSNLKEYSSDHIEAMSMEKAGPREKVFFEAKETTAGIVTCGGLSPGINNVIRGIVMSLHYFYGVQKILGVPYGYEGLIPKYGHGFIKLTPEHVKNIHEFGGTILGSSRGAQSVPDMVDTIEKNKINMLFTIGGDGTLKGADAIGEEIRKRNINCAVIGIPKTIDNDINLIDKSFGFETAFDIANPIIKDAHNEATGAYNGVAIVKLMGRDSGFIAASAALSMPVVNFVLIPEMSFELEGENGLLEALKNRLLQKKHAVIVVAEGAGQHLFNATEQQKDASGNVLHKDIGILLKNKINEYFKTIQHPITVKYIDPSYIIRSAPANANDSVFCTRLAHFAVHGAMAGKTRFVVGMLNGKFVHIPINEVTNKRKKIDLEGDFWYSVRESTGQLFKI
ncbi:ATP-dependent 6-phosphofructokinase [Aquimarina algicola]|uniref:ATP-dependent 6-phosphofructokinase n=1 Tax=Aquimarina algicola TaxID=2589995 RepID=A0A504JRU8_9FLAO|nr:ATP-dependent 6-phosphofructokinase [Aquimarina algicola]TPN89110.1 ATP-dependent 6-phosphofructokinase [Aquimarina algicola]